MTANSELGPHGRQMRAEAVEGVASYCRASNDFAISFDANVHSKCEPFNGNQCIWNVSYQPHMQHSTPPRAIVTRVLIPSPLASVTSISSCMAQTNLEEAKELCETGIGNTCGGIVEVPSIGFAPFRVADPDTDEELQQTSPFMFPDPGSFIDK